jgi:hypothetical protein
VVGAIKPIETRWGNWLFRSRLESRWAIFLNRLGIEFEYEKEGYTLPSGELYLPDLWLPRVHMWAEIKPTPFNATEKRKCSQLAVGTGYPCLMLPGAPTYRAYWAMQANTDERLGPIEENYWLDVYAHDRRYYEDEHRFYGSCWPLEWYESEENYSWQYRDAIADAVSARFEHGNAPLYFPPPLHVEDEIIAAVRSADSIQPARLADVLHINVNTLRCRLQEMVRNGELERSPTGSLSIPQEAFG